jgi:hypothetical protein
MQPTESFRSLSEVVLPDARFGKIVDVQCVRNATHQEQYSTEVRQKSTRDLTMKKKT